MEAKFIKLTSMSDQDFYLNASLIVSIALRYNVRKEPIGGTEIWLADGSCRDAKESPEEIVKEINRNRAYVTV